MSDRPRQILARFPAHLDASREGKLLGTVAESIALDLDTLSTDLAAVRRSHRLAHVDTVRDLLLEAGLHGLTGADFRLVSRRTTVVLELVKELTAAADATARTTKAEAVFELFGVAG